MYPELDEFTYEKVVKARHRSSYLSIVIGSGWITTFAFFEHRMVSLVG